MANLLEIDEKQVEKLAARFWKNTEIAAFFDCDEATIRKRFSDILAKGRETGRARLRDAQLKAALNGNPTMLIWLGKQLLGQKDSIEMEGKGFGDTKIILVTPKERLSENRVKSLSI